MSDHERERRATSDVPGFGRIGGIDDPVPRDEYGNDPETVREHTEAEATARDDRREELLELPTELRGEIRSYYGGEMETAGFVRRLRSISNELDRHADGIAERDEQADTEDGESR